MSSPLHRIKDWDRHFETSESRKRKGPLAWVGIPCKHDGRGFNRLRRQADWPAVYGAWSLIIQIGAKCPIRGTLADQDGPFTALDIADKVGLPEALVQRCLDLLTDQQIGIEWLEIAAETTVTPADASSQQQIPADSIPTIPNQTVPNHTKKPVASKKPKFEYYTWITAEDLSDASKILDWHSRVVKVKSPPLQDTDASRISTLAAASMALAKADDPKAWFVWCVKTDKFKSISQAAEDAASKSLKQLRRRQTDALGLFGNLVKSTTAAMVPDVDDEPFEDGEGDE